ncbi:DUF4190 domain-containing protein [Mycobacterium shimoidei]|uniref:DUF4190 domain-containing protein n=1 Tax=Mycobacterium shimoidei TaxID=29313 RepID=A0A1E3THP1_MYCSH|nr:DUF4190 domain-containing protein [Mycobacterium shimoidei]MCV7257471.1 DUF4190 domain-containing protein [Mycobacterium shimoidei]ODR13949.1 hypothetical protein BHQ16_07905 [Mycobacterium shimoidei]ORW77536.1 hypothetical protein AWC26_18950 [Mycobacterium shimoidei]SRX94197.1 hypothetical protein MSP7336_02445 [Mycobacterium shimoidei]
MTVPGGDPDEKAQDRPDQPSQPQQPQQNTGNFPPPSAGYPPPAYPPPSYPPPGGPPPGYAPGSYGGSPYPPPPADYRASAGGYGAPPQPGGYPDYTGGYGQPPTTNALAIASLVASLIGWVFCLSGVVGIVLGAIALNQIKQTRQQGYGLAVAGIAIGVVVLVVYLIAAITLGPRTFGVR